MPVNSSYLLSLFGSRPREEKAALERIGLTSTDWRELGVEAGREAVPLSRAHQEVTLVTDVLDPGVDGEVGGDQGGVGRLLRLAAGGGAVLADVVQVEVTAGVGPQPALRPVEPGAVLVPARQVPEGDGDRLPVDPLPVLRVLDVSPGSQPVLAVGVSPVSPPQLPGEETLEGGVGLVHQGASSLAAERVGLLEVPGLVVVENVTFPVVGGRAARPLVPGKYHRDQSTSHPIPPHSTRSWTTVQSRLHMVT